MIRFYFHPSPNPMKVALFLEESGLPYELVPVDTLKGEQHRPEFVALNPNAKTPVITDGDATVVFDSNAILLYLADKTGRFGGPAEQRGELLSWLMFVATGLGPYNGQAVHFQRFAPEKLPYAINRYVKEAERHYGILDRRLAGREFLLGDEYTIADMAAWGWTNPLPFVLDPDGFAAYPELKRWHEAVSARPAAARAQALKERLTLKTEFDEEARRAMFPQNVAAAA